MHNLIDKTSYSLNDFLKHYLDYLPIRFSKNTVETYSNRVVYIIAELNSKVNNNLSTLYDPKSIKRAFEDIVIDMDMYAPNYKNLTIAAFNDFCKFTCKNKSYFCNIKFQHMRKPAHLPKSINEKKLLLLIEHLQKNMTSWIDYRNFALIYLLYATGMRISEALYITPVDFYRDGMLIVRNAKNSKERVVYYPANVLHHIGEYRSRCPHETSKFLWKSLLGKKLSRIAASVAIKKLIGHSPHALRHSFATHLHSNGCDIFILSELLGHSSLINTQIYIKIRRKELQKCIMECHPLSKKCKRILSLF